MLDPEGSIISWNLGAERIKGYSAAEAIGRHLSLFFRASDIANRKPWRLLELARRDGRVEDEAWRLRKDGTVFWANVVITALLNHDGRLVGFGKVTRDLTERRKVEAPGGGGTMHLGPLRRAGRMDRGSDRARVGDAVVGQ